MDIYIYWISAKVRARFVNKNQAAVIVKNRLYSINDAFVIVLDNHFSMFNQFIDTTFKKSAWFCVKERYFISSIYTNRT